MTLQKREELLLFSETSSGSMKLVWTLKAWGYFSKWKLGGDLLGRGSVTSNGVEIGDWKACLECDSRFGLPVE